MTKRTFILNDGYNLFHRQIHVTNPAYGLDTVIGMALHMILNSMKKEFREWQADHAVFFLEGRSWRKDVYPGYKLSRKVEFLKKTPEEQQDHQILIEAFDDLVNYLVEKTNVTVLRNPTAEADDMIYSWILNHPDDNHVLVSSDSDFIQLLKFDNVRIYDPVKDILITREGIFNDKKKKLAFTLTTDAKIKVGKPDENFVPEEKWWEYALFLKCIRGDKSDNIFSAYPGVREKGTKKNIGIREAFNDIGNKGYSWNNFMLQRWVDHESVEHRVKDKYEFNKKLIDLAEMPDNIKESCRNIILEETAKKNVPASTIGTGFMKFCGKWDLKRISDSSNAFMELMTAKYEKN